MANNDINKEYCNPFEIITKFYNILPHNGRLILSFPNSKYELTDENGKNQDSFHLSVIDYKKMKFFLQKTGFEITQITRDKFKGLLNDLHNPHVLGLEANEALFLEDNIILVEGQEDVVILTRLANELGIKLKGEFFGWGVGGASKMQSFMALFSELGYKHVVALLDGDKKQEAEGIQRLFPNYKVIVLSTDDIRDKVSRTISAKNGIVGNNGQLKSEYRNYAEELLKKVNEGMS